MCWVNFPNHTTADVQVSVQYLVHGLRTMSARAGRPVAVFGISQGGLLPRIALTYWPSLRKRVSDVLSAAGTQHGTTVGSRAACREDGCTPAAFQQGAGSALPEGAQPPRPRRDPRARPPGRPCARPTDDTVQPTTGPHPASALKGATNVLIQDVCPGRAVTHIGTALDSVTFALFDDAITHRGPARRSRLPGDVCAHPYAPGLEDQATADLIGAAGNLTAGRGKEEPRVRREPPVRAWAKR